MADMRVGVLIYTYDRTDDARINMELVREAWPASPLLKDAIIVHAYNGREEWWPEKYLEDELVRTENPGHFLGAELLLNAGMETFAAKHPEVTHVIALASDTWCMVPSYVESVLRGMEEKGAHLATCAWGNARDTDMFKIGMALDFFIVETAFVRRTAFFPLRYPEFIAEHGDLLMYQDSMPYLERVAALRFKQAILKDKKLPSENLLKSVARAHIYEMEEREPVHYDKPQLFKKPIGKRQMEWPKLGLVTYHEAKDKQRALRRYRVPLGPEGERLRDAQDLSYFDRGKGMNVYLKEGKKIHYND